MATTSSPHELREEGSPHLEPTPMHIKSILAATDFSDQATLALKGAARLAKLFRSKLHVLYAEPPQVYTPGFDIQVPAMQEFDLDRARKQLHAYANKIPELRSVKHEEIVLYEPATEAIDSLVRAKEIDLVVMGSHGRSGLGKMVLGSVAEAAIRRLHCPVLVVGPLCARRYPPSKSVLLATDLPDASLRAAQYATSIAREFGAALTLVHVLPERVEAMGSSGASIEHGVAEALRRLVPRDAGLKKRLQFEIAMGEPAEEIVRVAEHGKAGLIVMGINERSVLADHAPWATLSGVIGKARCPVLAVAPHLV